MCAYSSNSSEAPSQSIPSKEGRDEDLQTGDDNWDQDDENETSNVSPTVATSSISDKMSNSSPLNEVFGDWGHSEFNTMALVRKVRCPERCYRPCPSQKIYMVTCRNNQLVHEDAVPHTKDIVISKDVRTEVRKVLDMMLTRPIYDFLVRYFMTEVNWFGAP